MIIIKILENEMISLNDIENFASNYAVYLRGLNYYNQKKVLDLQSMDSYGLNWNAKVQGTDNIYNISVGLNPAIKPSFTSLMLTQSSEAPKAFMYLSTFTLVSDLQAKKKRAEARA